MAGAGAGIRVVFAGTPQFALTALEALHGAGVDIALVLTQPDRPSGRGLRLHESPVKAFAQRLGIRVLQPAGLGEKFAAEAQNLRAALGPLHADVMVVAAYGLLLPSWLLQMQRWGCMNIHASLLPRWRGAAPIQRAIEAGDTQTGVTIMQMDAGLDSGDILLSQAMPIALDDTAGGLQHRLAELGGHLMVRALCLRAQDRLPASPQPAQGVTYARKLEKRESLIDWHSPAEHIARRVRAFDPFPGCTTKFAGEPVKVWRAALADQIFPPGVPAGTVLSAEPGGIIVAAQDRALRLTQLQRAGGKRLAAREFLHGFPVRAGTVLGA